MLDTNFRISSHNKMNPQQDIQKVPFNNALWREILNLTTEEVNSFFNLNIETISPFGFEVLMDKRFLYGILRRFYCYIGTKTNISDDIQLKIIQYFYEKLMHKLSFKYPALFSSIVLVVMKDDFLYLVDDQYICKSTDKLIDIQFRQVKTNILDDYSNYVIASLDELVSNKGDCRDYINNIRRRWRFYQLYIIQEKLYHKYLPNMSEYEAEQFRTLFALAGNMINVFFDNTSFNHELSADEELIFNQLILPRISLLYKLICGDGKNIITINSTAYHAKENLSLNIDKEIYEEIALKIKSTYHLYVMDSI